MHKIYKPVDMRRHSMLIDSEIDHALYKLITKTELNVQDVQAHSNFQRLQVLRQLPVNKSGLGIHHYTEIFGPMVYGKSVARFKAFIQVKVYLILYLTLLKKLLNHINMIPLYSKKLVLRIIMALITLMHMLMQFKKDNMLMFMIV